MKLFFTVYIMTLLVGGCTQIQKTADAILKPSAREVYAREFKNNDLDFRAWQRAFELAKKDSLQIKPPYVEEGTFISTGLFVYSYDVQLQKGEKLYIEVKVPNDSTGIFIDLFQKTSGLNPNLLISSEPGRTSLDYNVEETDVYKITI